MKQLCIKQRCYFSVRLRRRAIFEQMSGTLFLQRRWFGLKYLKKITVVISFLYLSLFQRNELLELCLKNHVKISSALNKLVSDRFRIRQMRNALSPKNAQLNCGILLPVIMLFQKRCIRNACSKLVDDLL